MTTIYAAVTPTIYYSSQEGLDTMTATYSQEAAATFVREPHEVRVARGARFMDKHARNDWFNGHHAVEVEDDLNERRTIDLSSLAMEDGNKCVVGQVYGDYGEGLGKLHLTPELGSFATWTPPAVDQEFEEACDRYIRAYGASGVQYACGFSEPDEEGSEGWDALTNAWKSAITSRRLLYDLAHPEPEVNTYQVSYAVEAADEDAALEEFEPERATVTLLHEGPIQ